MLTLRLKNLTLQTPRPAFIMGIVNVTSDSFFPPSRAENPAELLSLLKCLISGGADILDLGAQSTRPGHKTIPLEEELSRLENALRIIRPQTPLPISVDTSRPAVMRQALALGANILNDTSALTETPSPKSTQAPPLLSKRTNKTPPLPPLISAEKSTPQTAILPQPKIAETKTASQTLPASQPKIANKNSALHLQAIDANKNNTPQTSPAQSKRAEAKTAPQTPSYAQIKAFDAKVSSAPPAQSGEKTLSMAALVATAKIPVVLMDSYEASGSDAFKTVDKRLQESVDKALSCGIDKSAIIIDPGVGFGKDYDANIALINRAGALCGGEYPVLVGLSRKRCVKEFLQKAEFDKIAKSFLGESFKDFAALNGVFDKELLSTIVLNLLAIKNGAKIIRVHDTAAHKKAMEAMR